MSMRIKAALLIMAIVFAFTAASFFLSLSFTRRYMTDTIENELSLALDIADTVVTTKISLLESNAEIIATRLDAVSEAEMPKMMASQMEEFEDFLSLTVYDRAGAVAKYGEPVDHDVFLSESEFLQPAFGGESLLSSAHYSGKNGNFIIHVFVPMGTDRVLSATIPGMLFSDILSKYRLWQTGGIFMVDAEGTIVANFRSELVSEQRNFIRDAITDPELESAGKFYKTMISSDNGSGRYTLEGVERLCVYKHVSGSRAGWYIGVAAPLTESPLKKVQNGLSLSAVFFLVAGVFVSVFVSGIVIKPFKTIQAQAAKIREEHELATLFLDAMPLSGCLIDKNMNIFGCNEGAKRLFQLDDRQEFLDHFYDFSPEYQPDGRLSTEAAAGYINKAFEEGRCVFEWLHLRKDGTPLPAESTLVRITYDGEYAIAAYVRDLREYKRMMNEIEQQAAKICEAHQHTTLFLDAMPLSGCLIDKNMNVFRCNEGTARLFELDDRQEFINRFYDFSPEYQPDGRHSIEAAAGYINKAFEEGKCVFEWMHQRKDGSPLPAETTLVRITYDGEYAIAGYVRDLREHKRMMKEIGRNTNTLNTMNQVANILLQPESREFKEDLQRCMGMIGKAVGADRICIWKNGTKEGRLCCTQIYEWVGDARLRTDRSVSTDVPYEENIPTWEEILSKGKCINTLARDLSQIEQARMKIHGIRSLFVAPVFVHDEFWGFVGCDNCHDENVFTEDEESILYSGSLLIANAFLRNEMMSSIRDSSIKLEAALNDATRANNAKSSFLANMSHEMRTPLNAVIGLTDLTMGYDKLDEECFSNLEKIHNAGMTLMSTVNDILDISKIEAGRFELITAVYDIPSLLNDTVTQSIVHKGEKAIVFVLDIDGNLPAQLCGDELRVKQIINNLLSNAFKYTREGTVEMGVNCVREGDAVWVTVRVRDTGMGIHPEYVESIFEDYSQLDMRANRKIMGTGLGLSITKRLVDQMNGTINVESEYKKGSVFTVRFRQKFVGDTVIGPEMAGSLRNFHYYEQKRKQNSKLMRISIPYARVLVVDDVTTNLDVARGLMKPYGMQVDCMTGGQQAIDVIREGKVRYNAVFMDHMMPGMDGIEAARIIREIGTEYAKTVPIIALTANAVAGNEEMFLDKGFQAFISKPIELTRLDAVIRQWVRDKEQEKEYFGRQINVDGNIFPDTRSGRDRRVAIDRRSGSDRRKLGQINHEINVEKGLERFGGDEDVYLKVLRSFAVNTGPMLEEMKDVNRGNLTGYAVTVHGIKGASRGIFAEAVGDKAELLEKAANAGDFVFVSENNGDFIEAAEKLIEDLEITLDKIDGKNPKPKKDEPDKETLARFLAACAKFDMDGADEIMTELEQYEYKSGGELIASLRVSVDESDFARIIEKLS